MTLLVFFKEQGIKYETLFSFCSYLNKRVFKQRLKKKMYLQESDMKQINNSNKI